MRTNPLITVIRTGAIVLGLATPALAAPPLDTTLPNESVEQPNSLKPGQHEHVTVRATRPAPVPQLPPRVGTMPQQAFGVGNSPVSTRMQAPANCQDAYTTVGGQPSRQADRYTPIGAESCRGH